MRFFHLPKLFHIHLKNVLIIWNWKWWCQGKGAHVNYELTVHYIHTNPLIWGVEGETRHGIPEDSTLPFRRPCMFHSLACLEASFESIARGHNKARKWRAILRALRNVLDQERLGSHASGFLELAMLPLVESWLPILRDHDFRSPNFKFILSCHISSTLVCHPKFVWNRVE